MSKKHRYRFGMNYVGRLPIQFSLLHGWWCTDGYEIWLVNLTPKETSD